MIDKSQCGRRYTVTITIAKIYYQYIDSLEKHSFGKNTVWKKYSLGEIRNFIKSSWLQSSPKAPSPRRAARAFYLLKGGRGEVLVDILTEFSELFYG